MKQEDKDLLIQDLCARLPYGVKASYIVDDYEHDVVSIHTQLKNAVRINGKRLGSKYDKGPEIVESWTDVKCIKPYLFPLSSMAEEQFLELTELCNMYDNYHDYNPYEYWGIQVCRKHIHENKPCFSNNYKAIDWLNKNHFDYRGLIEKGLAIDCTALNVY